MDSGPKIPIIPLPESSAVLALFLRVLNPVELGCPALSSHLNLLPGVCQALSKYCAKNFPLAVKDALLLAASTKPEHVYAVSCRYAALADVAAAAAKQTLRKPQRLDNLPDAAVAEISALQYHALAKYQIACRAAAVTACSPTTLNWDAAFTPGAQLVRPDEYHKFHESCKCSAHYDYIALVHVSGPPDGPSVDEYECYIPQWLAEYCADVGGALRTGDVVSGEVALDRRWLAKAIEAGRECPSCGKDVQEFLHFAHGLKDAVNNAIDRVSAL